MRGRFLLLENLFRSFLKYYHFTGKKFSEKKNNITIIIIIMKKQQPTNQPTSVFEIQQ